ncbi:conjugative transfer relaxase/helicase TraI (plasmid) [Vibrio parahaemolyticus]|uniref:Conjugative transfer relaxase/helicase TraI n=1 Tax=Vibrio parahaemolyticus TaxID=670 RepID=A0AA47LA75_VIBPH|nr:conjugative transfer relaxase/helicase TraI [Vibrio parahaemolyticus]MBE3780019.1 conjugative transfer relaxase/helicase TraI [Vibrio parahaemolyticus]MCZ6249605.1 conjugative transfer relaxase/helicase TraI [Vibrio parahaemolyticus]MCZ6279348.1 conjugative transfer relaxase/helicase TraI [Vibrio parahaemolyticus]MDF5495447.1 conjugative transfer relaxase/helicase TraI [Vibrio parahaemolyticus]QHH02723.1 conjugative transfer relaxase/helicase TraI [Vibrio parahaemolyticus]
MMSISPLKSASNASQYYLGEENSQELPDASLEKDEGGNYYLKEQTQGENTFWHGKLAEEAGLLGKPVEQKTLESVLSGHLGDETIKGKRYDHKCGLDLTFSAPKGISTLALVGGDTRLIEAHDNAIKFVLNQIEKDVAQVTSINEDGVREFTNTENIAFAVVRHKTSRNNDPQIHSHVLAPNMTRDQKGQLRTLASSIKQKGGVINGSSERIYNFQKYYTALYQSQLAKGSEDIGFQMEGIGNGQFDVKGVPQPLLEAFSTRSQQIDQQALDFGDSQAARDTAALDTRKAKTYESDETLNARWQQTVRDKGYKPEELVQNALNVAKHEHNPELVAKEAFARTIEHLGQYNTALKLEKIIELAASDFTKGGVQANAIDLKIVADQWVKEGNLIPLAEKGQYTTKAMLDNEKSLMDVTKGRTHNMRTPVDDKTLDKLNLNQGNREKVASIYESTKQFHVVNVFGSSEQIAQNLLNVGNHAGKRVHLISQSAKDKQLHSQTIERQSHTVATWVKYLFTPEQRHSVHSLLHSDAPMTNKDVLLVDSANKMSASELIALSDKANESGSKLILLNNTSSRQGFKANNTIDLYSKGNVTSHNWVDSKHHDSKVALHDADTTTLARAYTNLSNKDDTQVLATSNLEQRRLTDAIRTSLQNDGQLARTGVTLFTQQPHYLSKPQQELAQHYKPGMTLRHWEDGKPQEYVVANIDTQNNLVHTLDKKEGNEHSFNLSSPEFKALNMQVFKPEALQVSQGERITTTGKHFPSGLNANERYVVTEISKDALTLVDTQGESKTLPVEALKDAPLKYDYVQSASHIEPRAHTLISGKAFTLSKELFHDLTAKSERIDVFTDNPEKAQSTLEKSEVKLSAIERVVETKNVNDRYLSNATETTLRHDITQALHLIAKEQNMPLQEKAVSFALNHLSEREAAFTQKELVVEAIRYAFEETNQPIVKEQIEAELAKRSDVLSAEYSDGTRWTTQAALDTEKHILRNVEQGKGQHPPFATQRQVSRYLDTQPRLTQGQGDSIKLISTTEDSFVAVQGLAGTGKSTMLESNIELIQQSTQAGKNQPRQVIGLAPTHAAVSELESKGVKAQTLESLLTDLRRGLTAPEDYKNTLFFLDESSMVSNRQASEFTDLVLQSDSKSVLLGDKEQLLSQSAGKPFELLMNQGRIDTAYMTDMIRQQTKPLLGAAQNILDKQPDSALDKLSKQEPDTQGNTQHVVSTLDENAKDKAKAQLIATEKLTHAAAQDYLGRTPETRENTLMIAYTNNERDLITEHVRVGLMKKEEIGKENVIATRLRSTSASKEELSTMIPYQKGLILSTKPGEYGTITKVDSEHGVVMVKDQETGIEKAFLPRNKDHKFTTLFAKSEKPLSSNDKIVTRFTNKERGIKANVEYRIESASHEGIIARSKDGQTLNINPTELKDGHWDYAYTRTADMAQGATYNHVITTIRSKGQLTSLRRAGIDLTRPKLHARIYTDNTKRMIRTWLSKEDIKASAIETLNDTLPQYMTYFNNNAFPHEDVRYQNQNGDFDYNKFKEHVNKELPKYTESLAKHLLGQPNQSKSDRDYLTFGIGKSAIKVSLTGEYRGYFKDYTTGEKGSLINLIMSHNELTYKDAMKEAHYMLNEPEKYQLEENNKHDKLLQTTPRHIAQFEERAKEYVQSSQPLTGTLAETYLGKLGIEKPQSEHVRFHQTVYSSEDKSFHPAMITNIHNKEGETKAIEVTYLDDQGNKDSTLDINPRTLGTKSKQMTNFHQGNDLNTTIISTSIENSFAIKQAFQGQYDIVNVNHKNDIQNLSTDELRQHIIIALSHGNTDLNPNNIEKIMENFSGRDIQFAAPENLLSEIQSCIDKYHHKDIDDKHELHQSESPIDKFNPPKEDVISQYSKEQDSKALEQFEPKEHSKQQELDFDNKHHDSMDREIERELER